MPCSELRLRRVEVSRHGTRAIDHALPFLGRAVGVRARRSHALDLPVDTTERLIHVAVDRALLIAPHRMLA